MSNEFFNEKPRAVLKDWYVNQFGMFGTYLVGYTYGHPKFKDGTYVSTSTILNVIENPGEWIVETRNTIYVCRLEDHA